MSYITERKNKFINVIVPNDTSFGHLAEVKQYMIEHGSPIIRAIEGNGCLVAIEGSHRIAAARQLEIPVIFEILNGDEIIDHDFRDIFYKMTSQDIVNEIYDDGVRCSLDPEEYLIKDK